jgi:hypothetical protein
MLRKSGLCLLLLTVVCVWGGGAGGAGSGILPVCSCQGAAARQASADGALQQLMGLTGGVDW